MKSGLIRYFLSLFVWDSGNMWVYMAAKQKLWIIAHFHFLAGTVFVLFCFVFFPAAAGFILSPS